MKRFSATLALVSVFGVVNAAGVRADSTAQSANPPATRPVKQADVPVKSVSLFSSGVGYFQHEGIVNGNSAAELRFKTSQINDILKSLVLQDMDHGTVSTVVYPSQDPISKTLRSFQVDITNNPPLADLLNQLRGAKLTITRNDGTNSTGIVLGVEKKQQSAGDDKHPAVQVAVLNLIDGARIQSIRLDETISDIKLDDPALQDELAKALVALSQSRDQDKKPVTINFNGEGERHVRIGYVVETPVWKTSYRLILPADAKEKPKLQGWAIVENQTDNDWNGIQLNLISGRPISFVQDLYQPLYIPRPVVQPELFASLKPQVYAGGISMAKAEKEAIPPAESPTPAAASVGLFAGGASSRGADRRLAAPMNATSSINAIASTAQLGELFQYTVSQPVTLPRQKSAMLPIITDDIECEKVSIYNAAVLDKNPLNGARLKNTTGKHLLQGPITVLEGSGYAGDARIDNVPPGQERLLSYGIDLQMPVDSTKNKTEDHVQSGKIVKGVLTITTKTESTQDYLADNKSDHDKTLIVEHPIKPEWKLIDTPKPIETTDSLYRFKETVPAGKTTALTVKEEIVNNEEVAILPTGVEQVLIYSRTGEFSRNVRDALAQAAKLKQAAAEFDRQIAENVRKTNAVAADQQRTRENMKVVGQNNAKGEYYKKLENNLQAQDAQIAKLSEERDDLAQKRDDAQKKLADYLNDLTIE